MNEAYRRAVERIRSRGRFGSLGLGRMERVAAALGHPERAFRTAHIAGTNGKGSTAAFLENILRQSGHRVGLYTSPHVVDWRERVQVDREWIAEADVIRHLAAIEGAQGEAGDPLTEFEIWTLMAFLAFREAEVDIAVVEVGLGGRLDATNIVTPDACAITTVSLDHVERLGPDIPSIAFEKAGILKPGVPAVLGSLVPEALAVVTRRAHEVGAPLLRLGHEIALVPHGKGQALEALGTRVVLEPSLSGRHQVDNAAVAATMALLLEPGVRPAAIEAGVSQCRLSGRLEVLQKSPPVVADAAKNVMGMQALGAYLDREYPSLGVRLLFGCLGERNPAALLEPLAGRVTRLAVHALDDGRALPMEDLVAAAAQVGLVPEEAPTIEECLAFLGATGKGEVGVAAGSFYLVGPLIAAWNRSRIGSVQA